MGAADDDLITTAQAAELLGVSVQQVRAYARIEDEAHRLPGKLIGRDWLFRRGDVKAYKPRPRGKPKKPLAKKPRGKGKK